MFQVGNALAKYCSQSCLNKAFSQRHPGYMVEAQRRHLQKADKKEKRDVRMLVYRNSPVNKARANLLRRLRYRNDPERRDRINAYVRARRERYLVGHTRDEWEALKAVYEQRCAYCGRKSQRLTKDHIVPISQGAPSTVDVITNIVPACRSCNSRKHTKQAPSYQKVLTLS